MNELVQTASFHLSMHNEGLARAAGFVTACEHPWNLQGGKAKAFALAETAEQK